MYHFSKDQTDSKILDTLFKVYDYLLINEGITPRKSKKHTKDIGFLSNFFDCSEYMVMIIVKLFVGQVCYGFTKNDFKEVVHDFNLEPVQLFQLSLEFSDLKKKGFFKVKSSFEERLILSNKCLKAIYSSNKIILNHEKTEDSYKALLNIRAAISDLSEEQDDQETAIYDIVKDASVMKDERLGNYVLQSPLKDHEKLTLFWIAANFLLRGDEVFDLTEIFESILAHSYNVYVALKNVKYNSSKLITDEYLAFKDGNLNDLKAVEIGSKMRNILIEDFDCALVLNCNDTRIQHAIKITPQNITAINLHFNKDFEPQIGKLIKLLSDETVNMISDKGNKMFAHTGLTILMHGLPGTGKTELVKQIARQHNRLIFLVEVSSIKSMWVGSSEKHLTTIFKDYRHAVIQSKKKNVPIPILLFNEADAIFSRRIDVSSSVDQMNNSLQNILLQELEDFDGIFIATTNNMKQFDDAFDRRFLFKLAFPKPDLNTRFKILKNEMVDVPDFILLDVAAKFELSGGQIANIKKKVFFDALLSDSQDNESIFKYAKEECQFRKNDSKQIGFAREN